MKAHEAYIKAITSIGGDHEDEYSEYLTTDNEAAFESWLASQPKVSGKTLYRGYKLDRSFYEDGDYSDGAVLSPLSLTGGFHPAFTEGLLRAAGYINEFGSDSDDGVKLFFELRTSGKYMVDVSEHSVYSCESEHHCTADARFKVVKNERRGALIQITLEEI